MKKHLSSVLTLFIICAVVSVALAAVNGVTAPIILERQQQAAAGALLEVMPEGGTFEQVDLSEYELPATVKEAHKASNGGYVFKVFFRGKNPDNIAMIGVSADGQITGTKSITITDDAAYAGKHFPIFDANGHFNGADITTIDGVDTVAGATLSTAGYRAAVKDALNAATILGGGSVDIRTPEQILSDNNNTALGTSGVEFDKHFFVEVVEGVDAIYVAKNGAGHVVVIGGNFIGVANGAVVAGVDATTNAITVSDADKATAIAVVETIKATTITEFDISGFELPANISDYINSVEITNNGVYVIEIKADGYALKGSYGKKQPIVILVSVTADGKIVDCMTLEQHETDGLGDFCAKEEFYGQFDGTTEGDYTDTRLEIQPADRKDYVSDIDAVAGSTITSAEYKLAIMKVFNAVKIFEGGAD